MPPRVEYALTKRGHSILPLMHPLTDWDYNNLHNIIADRQQYHSQG